jgi:glycosidase
MSHSPQGCTTSGGTTPVVYQVCPRSFADSYGDGMGDLPGVTARLSYLRDLGVDAIWLSPFYTSPQRDGGYDAADYTDVDPRFGSLADADKLIAHSHELRLEVTVDIVTNQWYLHIFDTSQPDWNWENPRVSELFQEVLRFWLDRGVDGFRVDVAHGMIEPEGLPDATVNSEGLINIPEGEVPVYFDNDRVLDIDREWRPFLDSYEGERMMVLEAWIPDHRLPLYIGAEQAHLSFNFGFLQARWGVDTMRAAIAEPLALAEAVGAPTTWVLSNHDVIRHPRYGFAPDCRFGEDLVVASHLAALVPRQGEPSFRVERAHRGA